MKLICKSHIKLTVNNEEKSFISILFLQCHKEIATVAATINVWQISMALFLQDHQAKYTNIK